MTTLSLYRTSPRRGPLTKIQPGSRLRQVWTGRTATVHHVTKEGAHVTADDPSRWSRMFRDTFCVPRAELDLWEVC